MTTYSIPQRYVEGFQQLMDIEEPAFERLAAALAEAAPRLAVHAIYHEVAEKADITPASAGAILDSAISVASLAGRERLTPAAAARSIDSSELKGDAAVFTGRLERLLATNALRVTVAAIEAAVAGERLFSSSRVSTDVRPIVVPSEVPPPTLAAAIVLHKLQIDYSEDGQDRTFSVLLDREDIARLRGDLDLADASRSTMTDMLNTANVPYLASEAADE